jgi:hypothetical protein
LGRWTSCDPASISKSPNLYEYVESRPLLLIDKSGLGSSHWIDFSLLDELAEAVDSNLNAEARNTAIEKPKEDVNIPLAVAKEAVTSGYDLATKAPVGVALQAGKTWQNEFVAAVVTPNSNQATAHGVKAVGAAVRFTAASILAYEAARKKIAAADPAQMAPEPNAPPPAPDVPAPDAPPATPAPPAPAAPPEPPAPAPAAPPVPPAPAPAAPPAAPPPLTPVPEPDAPPAAPESEPPASDPALEDPPVRGERFRRGQGLNQAEGAGAGRTGRINERKKLMEDPNSEASQEWGDQPLPKQEGIADDSKSKKRWDR